ncbi:MAG: hypothetical protein Q8R53_06385 [Nanoarchaeota archaeon]|nr:hypothetical protein [Nanoarchaeota archaeon]
MAETRGVFKFYTQTCTHCGKKFESPIQFALPGKPLYCKACSTQMLVRRREKFAPVSQLQKRLIAEGFSLEQEDEKIARQINDLLNREESGISEPDEELLSSLTEKLLKDEKRRRRIIKAVLKLQRKKK